jgi:hypothetical protein
MSRWCISNDLPGGILAKRMTLVAVGALGVEMSLDLVYTSVTSHWMMQRLSSLIEVVLLPICLYLSYHCYGDRQNQSYKAELYL